MVEEDEEGGNQREKPELVPRAMSPWVEPSPPEVGLVDEEGDEQTRSRYAQQDIDCHQSWTHDVLSLDSRTEDTSIIPQPRNIKAVIQKTPFGVFFDNAYAW